jgi:hypothetical protein
MEYLCLVSLQERQLDALSKSEDDALVIEALACDEEGRRSAHLPRPADRIPTPV